MGDVLKLLTREELIAFMEARRARRMQAAKTSAARATLCYGSRPNSDAPMYDDRNVADSGDCSAK